MAFISSFRFLAPAAVLLTLSVAASAQTKVGVVNIQQALLSTAEIKKASADLEAKFKPRTSQMESLRKEIDGIQQKLQSMAGKLSQQAEQDLVLDGQRKQRELQRMSEDVQAEVELARNDALRQAGARLQQVVTKLAEAKGLDLIIDSTQALFFKPALDLTSEAVAEYDKAFPPK